MKKITSILLVSGAVTVFIGGASILPSQASPTASPLQVTSPTGQAPLNDALAPDKHDLLKQHAFASNGLA